MRLRKVANVTHSISHCKVNNVKNDCKSIYLKQKIEYELAILLYPILVRNWAALQL